MQRERVRREPTPLRRAAGAFVLFFLFVSFWTAPSEAAAQGMEAFQQSLSLFIERNPGDWILGPVVDGRLSWMAGLGDGVPSGWKGPADLETECGGLPGEDRVWWEAAEETDPAGGGRGDRDPPMLDLSGVPFVTNEGVLPVVAAYRDSGSEVQPESVRVRLNGRDVTSLFEITPWEAFSREPLEMQPGRNTITVVVRDAAGNVAEQGAPVRRLDEEEWAMAGVSRAFLVETASLLGLEMEGTELILGSVERASIPVDGLPEPVPLAFFSYVLRMDGLAVPEPAVSTLFLRNPATGRFEPVGVFRSLGENPEPEVRGGEVLSRETARRIMAEHVALGDARLISQPVLRWARAEHAALRPAYAAFRYGVRSEDLDEGASPEDAFSALRLVVDAVTGDVLQVRPLLRHADVVRDVIDGPPDDLDQSLKATTLRDVKQTLKTVLLPGGKSGGAYAFTYYLYQADGPYAKVLNHAEIVNLLIAAVLNPNKGEVACFTEYTAGFAPDAFSSAAAGTSGNSDADESLDAWTAYHHTDKVARFLKEQVGFSHDFASVTPSAQMIVGVNPSGMASNAAALPKLVDLPAKTVYERFGLVLGGGAGYAATQYQGGTQYIRADFARDREVTYHEYGHTVLFAKGFQGVNDLEDTLHEGFADYLTRVVLGGKPDIISAFILNGNGHPLSLQRYSGAVLPSHTKFVALDADDPVDPSVDEHISGQAFSQALALAEERVVKRYGAAATDILTLTTLSAALWSVKQDASTVVRSLLFLETVRHILDVIFGGGTTPARDDEIRTALALHGIVDAADGREASFRLNLGEGATYKQGSDTGYLATTGINTRFTLAFSLSSAGAPVCHSESQASIPVASGSSTRFALGAFSLPGLVQDCSIPKGGSATDVYARIVSCGNAADCLGSGAANVRMMDGPPIAFRVLP